MKSFKKIALSMIGAALALGMAGCTPAENQAAETAELTYADTIAWDATYDVVVPGFGGAGAVTALTAAAEGAKVLVVEKAPEGHEGGNTKYSSQRFLYTEDVESMKTYLKAVRGLYTNMSDEIVDYIAEGCAENLDWWTNDIQAPFADPKVEPEYKDLPCSEVVQKIYTVSGDNETRFWNVLRSRVVANESIEVWYEAPATHLIQDPFSKTVLGVQVEKDGKTLNIRANNGVVLATGGFENNNEMVQDYLQKPYMGILGSPYNTGDGVKMAEEIGANLWHMSALSGPFLEFVNPASTQGYRQLMGTTGSIKDASAIFVGADGTRFIDETVQPKHGHVNFHGMYIDMPISFPLYCIFDQAQCDTKPLYKVWSKGMVEEVEKGWIVKADTLEELGEKIGLSGEALVKTVADYNKICETGNDPLGRKAENLHAIGDGPYYAFELTPVNLNTQGGPERNTNCEVLDTNGNAIPHLYSAGELGSFFGSLYQGSGNLAECAITGRTAGKNAAAPKEALAPIKLEKAVQPEQYTNTDKKEEFTAGENEYIVETIGMVPMTLKVTIEGTEIKAIEALVNDETKELGDKALDKMIARIIEAQSTEVDTCSGATLTSLGVIKGVEKALEMAGVSAEEETTVDVSSLADNQYLVSAQGMDEIQLVVTIDNGTITAIDIVKENETNGIGDKAVPVVIESIIKANSVEVDSVSGATVSSTAVKEAVQKALDEAAK